MICLNPNFKMINSGDRVLYRGEPGLLLRCYSDGIGHIRLDNGRVVAALVQELESARRPARDEGDSRAARLCGI
jgi:hypothetical protein